MSNLLKSSCEVLRMWTQLTISFSTFAASIGRRPKPQRVTPADVHKSWIHFSLTNNWRKIVYVQITRKIIIGKSENLRLIIKLTWHALYFVKFKVYFVFYCSCVSVSMCVMCFYDYTGLCPTLNACIRLIDWQRQEVVVGGVLSGVVGLTACPLVSRCLHQLQISTRRHLLLLLLFLSCRLISHSTRSLRSVLQFALQSRKAKYRPLRIGFSAICNILCECDECNTVDCVETYLFKVISWPWSTACSTWTHMRYRNVRHYQLSGLSGVRLPPNTVVRDSSWNKAYYLWMRSVCNLSICQSAVFLYAGEVL